MQKIKFTDPQTNDVVEFAVEEETTLNGTRYQMVEDDVEFSAIAKVFSELTDDDTALEY